jgi:hypothetical protein
MGGDVMLLSQLVNSMSDAVDKLSNAKTGQDKIKKEILQFQSKINSEIDKFL